MGYRIRVLSTSDQPVPLQRLRNALLRERMSAAIESDPDAENSWEQIALSHIDGPEIASIERNPVAPTSLGEAELEEFADEIAEEKPSSAVAWLRDYFKRIRSIYALQLLSGTEVKNGWEILGCVKNSIWSFAPSIIQADMEGFTNEDGYHILWQFSDKVKGSWAMGVLENNAWIHFRMDLGNRSHRKAFLNGKVPDGVTIIR